MEQGLYHLAALLLLLGCVSAVGALLCFWEGRWRFFRGCVVLGAAPPWRRPPSVSWPA